MLRFGRLSSRVLKKAKFPRDLKLICPVQSRRGQYSCFFFSEFMILFPHPARSRGAFANVTKRWVGCDGRFSSQRASRMRTNEESRTAKSRGPDTP
ncbi:MAG: hypothetical protein E6848_33700, partial [Bradyrhizobium sp.]|nr:hypothetical protein [Bradyrhizobium sp.]